MRQLQKVNSKILALLTALLLAVITLFAGANIANPSKINADASGMTYIDTQVEAVNFLQGGKVIFAFRLSECDYADFYEPVGDFPEGSARHAYITSLSYWKNFSEMNSKGVEFNQYFAYWNGGWGDSQIGLSRGSKAVGHQSALVRLEYGFLIYFPAGTTFPCLEYIVNGCQGTPVAYKTTEDVSFCYNGSEFVKIDYRVANARMEALNQMKTIDTSKYLPAEQQQVSALAQQTETLLGSCVTLFEVQTAMAKFNAALSEIKTVEYYAELNDKKAQVKQEILEYFNTFVESMYGAEEWNALMQMKAESGDLIDEAADFNGVDDVVEGIQYKAECILTEAEKPAVEALIQEVIAGVENAFDASLYRETEAAQGAALVEEAKALLNGLDASTKSVDAVEAIELSYLAKIAALKTAAEWDAEEEANKETETPNPNPEQPEQPQQPSASDDAEEGGCGSTVGSTLVVISLAMMFSLILIKKNNKKRMDN